MNVWSRLLNSNPNDPLAYLNSIGYVPQAPALSVEAVSPVAKGSGLTIEAGAKTASSEDEANKSGGKETLTKALLMTDDEFQDAYGRVARTPAIQSQLQGIDDIQNLLAMDLDSGGDYLSMPLAGLLESEFGRKASSFTAGRGASPEEKRGRFMAGLSKIQDDRRDVSKTISDYIAKQKAGTLTQLAYNELLNRTGQKSEATTETKAEDPNKFIKGGSKKGYDPTRDLEKHQKRMEGLQGLLTTYQDLDGLLGGIENWDGKADIPGIGMTGKVPSALLSKKGSDIQQTYADLKNQLLYMRSGKQINEQEFRRLSVALGSSATGTDREFANALVRFGKELKDVMKQKEAAVRGAPQGSMVMDLYKKGGGTLSDDFVPPSERKPTKEPKKKMSYEEWVKAGKPKAGG
jgi:hypothetical protein